MKNWVLLLALLQGVYVQVLAQNIASIEYFIDSDPGFGKGKSIGFQSSPDVDALNFNANLTAVASGFHMLYMRSKDENGNWSFIVGRPFVKIAPPKPLGKVVYIEYYVDNDPGFGKATALAFTPADSVKDLTFVAELGKLEPGLHMLAIRSKDANGNWGFLGRKGFVQIAPPIPASKIVKIEYFIDKDPGFGQAISVPVPTPSLDVQNISFTVNLDTLSLGDHLLVVRSQDSVGRWGLTEAKVFKKTKATGLQGDIREVQLFDVFPNPSEGLVHVKLKEEYTIGNEPLEVMDQYGTVIYQVATSRETTIDLSGFPKGIYFLRTSKGKQLYFCKILLK